MQFAVLNANRLWHRNGSLHPAFHGFTQLLSRKNIDIVFMSELNFPVHPTLPNDQPFRFIGCPGSLGRDAGFLVTERIVLEQFHGISDSTNMVWRLMPASSGDPPTALCSFWAPHVGLPEPSRTQFWSRMHTCISVIKQQIPGVNFLIAGDSNLWIPGLVAGRDARSQDVGPLSQLNVILSEFDLSLRNPNQCPTHSAGAALDLVIASDDVVIDPVVVHNGSDCSCPLPLECCPV